MLPTLFTIWFLHFVAVATPGPNALVVSRIAASERGHGAAFAVAGVTLGAFFWSASAILGVHLLFQAFPGMRLGLQVAGGMYLLYSGWKLWRARHAARPQDAQGGLPAAAMPGRVAFRQGLLTNLTNPKSALFFGSIFAAAFPPAPTLALQVATVLVVMANAATWYGLLAWLFSRPSVRDAYGRARGRINGVAAGLFGLMGAGLLVAALREARARV
jgi:threonine efflux protein